MPDHKTVAERIRTLREQGGLTQVELSVAVGVSRGHLAKIETGREMPGREMMMALAQHFEVSLDWLARGVGDMRPARAMNEKEALLLYAYRHMAEEEAEGFLEHMLKRAGKSRA